MSTRARSGSPDAAADPYAVPLVDPLNEFESHPEAADEARSPPGQWRLLSAGLMCWAFVSWAIVAPGRGGATALLAAASGTATVAVWALYRYGRTRSRGVALDDSAGDALGNARSNAAVSAPGVSTAAVSMLALLCGAVLLLGARVHTLDTQRESPYFQHAAAAGTPVEFEARLSGFPEKKRTSFGDREWVRIEATVPDDSDSARSGPSAGGSVAMVLWLSDVDASRRTGQWGPGTRIRITAKLSAGAAADPAAYTASPSSLRELHDTAPNLGSRIGTAAATFRTLLVEHASEIPRAELVPGFAVGDTSLVSEALTELMIESSLSHLTAVSGSNTGLVIAAMTWCVSRLGAGRRLRALAAGGALTVFVLIVGPDASVLRATVMATVLLIGSFGGRRAAALPALGLAILALLLFDPWQALQPGFALSVAATLGILLLATSTSRWLRTRWRLPAVLALPVSVALAAQLACAPLLLLLQPGLPAIGVVANLVAAPAAPLGTGLGLIAAVTGPISPDAAVLSVRAASVAASWVAATAEVCAALPGGRWNWPQGWPGALLLGACQLALLAAWALATGRIGLPLGARVAMRRPWQTPPRVPQQIRFAIALLTSAAIAVFASVTLLYPIAKRLATPTEWLLVACDIGQGDALLARDPDDPDEVILIDTGDDPAALERCLANFGVRRISLLVVTHDDRDHAGAITSVLARVEAAMIAPTASGEPLEQRALVRTLSEAEVPYRIGSTGMRGATGASDGDGVEWLVLAPAQDAKPADTNAASLVLALSIDGHRALMLADTGYEEQSALLRSLETNTDTRAPLTSVEIVKVAHHGSRDQDPMLYERIGAQWGLVSVGADNRYGHPNREALGMLARAGTLALRTDQLGDVALVRQPDGTLSVWAEHGQ